MPSTEKEVTLKGQPVCRGIAIGKPFFLIRNDYTVFETSPGVALMPREVERYRMALSRCKQDIKRLQKQLAGESASEGISVLEGQLEMLRDPILTSEIENEIHSSQKNAEFVFRQFIDKLKSRFQSLNDSFFEDRFKDLQNLASRVFSYLHDPDYLSLEKVPVNSVVCAHELTAFDAAGAHSFCVSAFLTESGGATTHAAIVAKAKGIPYVTNIDLRLVKESFHQLMIVDGRIGNVIINPSDRTLADYRKLQEKMNDRTEALREIAHRPAQTYDGFSVRLYANLDIMQEIKSIRESGGEGVGLFRSEYIFLPDYEIPSEDEQFQIYSRLVEEMDPLPVVIRTFDPGRDKIPISPSFFGESGFFLGMRSTRFLLKERSILKTQLRAILRASVRGNVSILIPMVATLSELREVKKMICEAREELGLFHPVRLGCMIEVPSAALMIDHFAEECDFFSIGTNDLTQYTLAIDRGDQAIDEFHETADPSLIRFIHLIITEAKKAGIPVSVCGEIASDPRFTALLLGLGVRELSVTPGYLPLIKNVVRRTSIVDAVHLSERVLSMTESKEILRVLNAHYSETVPEDLFYTETR